MNALPISTGNTTQKTFFGNMLCGTGQQGGVIERSGVPRLLSLRGRAWHAFGKKGGLLIISS